MGNLGAMYAQMRQKKPFPYAAGLVFNVGDHVFLVNGSAVPASSLTALGSAALDQAAYAPVYLGTAAEQKLSTDVAGTVDVDLCTESVRTITSGTYAVDQLVTFAELGGNAGLDPQAVAPTSDPRLAIGRVVVATGSGATSVQVEIFGKLFPFAAPGSNPKFVFGQQTTVTASDTVVTSLSEVLGVVAQLQDAPVLGCDRATASAGNQTGAPAAGSIYVQTWCPTSNANPTPIAATTFGKKVNWIAYGY